MKRHASDYTFAHRRRRKVKHVLFWAGLLLVIEVAAVLLLAPQPKISTPLQVPTPTPTPVPQKAGDVLGIDSTTTLTGAQTAALIRHNYPGGVPNAATPITKTIFHYRSQLPDGKFVTVYGRAYLPAGDRGNMPIFGFAPGTTGIGDQCAASLEKPAVANWADYDSHMAAYATQGYAAVITDYEGMRDATRIHHYMVGELEGRAVIDSVRALRQLPAAKGRLKEDVFLGGYSQGGHAAFWADKISPKYSPDVSPLGVVGFGPVMSVKDTLVDVTHGANINWFGPNVVYSYQDYYGKNFPGVILPSREATMAKDVTAHCIDTDLPYWGYTPNNIYTPEFIAAARDGQINTAYPDFAKALDENSVGSVETPSAKRINQGEQDNVVLASQQVAAMPALCASSEGPVQYSPYPNTTHYNTMLHSFNDTLNWMKAVADSQPVTSTCT